MECVELKTNSLELDVLRVRIPQTIRSIIPLVSNNISTVSFIEYFQATPYNYDIDV